MPTPSEIKRSLLRDANKEAKKSRAIHEAQLEAERQETRLAALEAQKAKSKSDIVQIKKRHRSREGRTAGTIMLKRDRNKRSGEEHMHESQ